ncbi:cation:proton antiporter [Nitrososphaera sp.]|uniref:cation:proton antiporter n=1 Tax=Nitrososphaera sp. TaxID=1971748 RepID=UPI00307DEDDA
MAAEELFVSVIIILVAARVLGELFQRIKQPPLVGEILAGVILGPSLFGIIHFNSDLGVLSDLAVFFLMLLAGLEMDPREIRKAGRYAMVISLIAFVVPFAAGTAVSHLFGLALEQSLFMGLLLSITAVPVSAIVLMQFGILRSKLGNTVITSAVINDIISLVVLSIVLQVGQAEAGAQLDFGGVAWSAVKIGAFLAGIFFFDFLLRGTSHWLPARVEPYFKKLQTKEAAFGILLIITIAISLVAQEIGLHFIIGTFFSGLVIYKEIIGKQNFDRVYGIISAITFGFFAPMFFAIIGIEINLQSIASSIPFFAALLAVAVATKIGGGYLGARIVKFKNDTSLAIGFLMNGRGMVELVIASIGFAAGIIDLTLFSIAVAIGFATTLMAPVTARPFVVRAKTHDGQAVAVEEGGGDGRDGGSGGKAAYEV